MHLASHLLVLITIATHLAAGLGPCCEVSPESVDSITRGQWCQSQLSVCNTVCSDDTTENSCIADSFSVSCTCNINQQPVEANLTAYKGSLASLECNEWVNQCVAQASSAEDTSSCRAHVCGSDTPSATGSQGSAGTTAPSTTASQASSGISSATLLTTSHDTQVSVIFISDSKTLTYSSSETSKASIFHLSGLPSIQTTRGSASSTPTDESASSTPTDGSANSTSTGLSSIQTSPAPKSRLSSGAKAGIGIGVALGISAVGLLGVYYRRRRKGGLGTFSYHRSTVHGGMPELETKERAGELNGSIPFQKRTSVELHGNEIYQMPGHESTVNGTPFIAATTRPGPHDAARSTRGSVVPQPRSQQSEHASPFAGAGPVPMHLTEDELLAHSVDDTQSYEETAPETTSRDTHPSSAHAEGPFAATAPSLASRDAAAVEDEPDHRRSAELAALRTELAKVREERDRLQMMHSLSAREEELRRAIEIREMG